MKLSAAAQLVMVMALGESKARHLGSDDLEMEYLIIGLLKVTDVQARPKGLSEAGWDEVGREIGALAGHRARVPVSPVQMRRRLRFVVAQAHPGPPGFGGGRSLVIDVRGEEPARSCPRKGP